MLREEEKGDESKEETKDFQIIDLKNELRMSQDVRDKSDKYADLLNDLFHKGIIDEDGNFINDDQALNE